MKYADLPVEIFENDDVIVTLNQGNPTNWPLGISKFKDTKCCTFEFIIKNKKDMKKRLNRKFLDTMMKDPKMHNALYSRIFDFVENNELEIEENFDFNFCWSDIRCGISGNRLIVMFTFKNQEEINKASQLLWSTKRWCF